jgi:iron complex outermembrane receptor protein
MSGARGNVTFGMDVQKQDIVYGRDRDFTSEGLSRFGFPGSYFAYLLTEDPRNPTGQFLTVGTFPDPRCPAELGSDPDFPWSVEAPSGWGSNMCRYAWWGEGALEAANDTKSFFVDANYEITDRAEFFARGLFSYNDVTGRYAASPVWQLEMSQDTPQNPTDPENPTNYRGDPFGGQSVEVDTDGDGMPDTSVEGPFDVSIFYRNVPGGNRDHGWDDTLLDYVAGVRGSLDFLGGSDWELAAQWSEQTSSLTGQGEALYQFLQTEIDDGNFDLFGVSGPYGQDEIASAQRATATRSGDARHRITGGDGQITFDAFQLENGPMPVVLGFEYRDEDFDLNFDEQTNADAFGGDDADIQDQSGARVVKSLFVETAIPLLPQLELNLAARYDDYNDFGTTVNPKASVAFRPLDTLLLRASYGTGFRAPEMEVLYQPFFTVSDYFIDTWRCSLTEADTDGDGRPNVPEDDLPAFHPCQAQWYEEVMFGGDPDLEPEQSDNWTAGFVWSPTADVSLMLDYYNIEIDDQVGYGLAQDVLDEEFRLRQSGETGARVGDVIRQPSGRLESVFTRYINVDRVETDGVDAEVSYGFSVRALGDFSASLVWTHVLNYEVKYGDGTTFDPLGTIGEPEDRGQLTVNWALGDYSATIIGNYISDQKSPDWYGDGTDAHLASFTTWDVQGSYSTPWSGQITIGARNVLDRDPPYHETGGGVGYDMWQHEVYGRVPYLRLEQDF